MAETIFTKIQFKRGTGSPGTTLDVAEPGYDTQNNKFYVGTGDGNQPIELAKKEDIPASGEVMEFKTINGEVITGSGNIQIESEPLPTFKTVGSQSIVGSGDIPLPTVPSFKTINGEVITGDGNINTVVDATVIREAVLDHLEENPVTATPIVDSLYSSDENSALSAKAGGLLNSKLEGAGFLGNIAPIVSTDFKSYPESIGVSTLTWTGDDTSGFVRLTSALSAVGVYAVTDNPNPIKIKWSSPNAIGSTTNYVIIGEDDINIYTLRFTSTQIQLYKLTKAGSYSSINAKDVTYTMAVGDVLTYYRDNKILKVLKNDTPLVEYDFTTTPLGRVAVGFYSTYYSTYTNRDLLQYETDNTYSPFVNTINAVTENATNLSNRVEEIEELYTDHSNMFDINQLSQGFMGSTGGVNAGYGGHQTTHHIPVKPNKRIVFSVNYTVFNPYMVAQYDKDFVIIDYIQDYNESYVDTLPNAAYIRVGKSSPFAANTKFEYDTPTKFTPYGQEYLLLNSKNQSEYQQLWRGLKMLTLGDSITAGGWPTSVARKLGATLTNVAVVNAKMKDSSASIVYDGNPTSSGSTNFVGNQVQKVLNNKLAGTEGYEDFDIILIAGGTNDTIDLDNPETLDTIETQFTTAYSTGGSSFTVVPIETVNRTTWAGSMRWTHDKLYEAYPKAKIFFMTPIQEIMESYKSIKLKGDTIDMIADRLSVETIDVRRCGILNTREHPDTKVDLADGIHPSGSGNAKMANYVTNYLLKYFLRINNTYN